MIGIIVELERRKRMLSEHAGNFSQDAAPDWLAEKGEVWAVLRGISLSDNEVAKIILETRSRKLTSISKAEVRTSGLAKMPPRGK